MNTVTDSGKKPAEHDSVKAAAETPKTAANVVEIWKDEESGLEIKLKKGKARHANNASKLMNGDQSLYMPALMAQLIEIDGKNPTLEDVQDLPLSTYNSIVGKMADANFI